MYTRDAGIYIAYGIECRKGNNLICSVNDISSDRDLVQRIVNKFNSYKLSPIHIFEALENELGK